MTSRADVVAEARRWLGVPYAHQGRTRAGVDCGGLVGAVAVMLGRVPADWWAAQFDPLHAGYGRQPALGRLQGICERWMLRMPQARPGDVLLMRFEAEPQHLAIAADYRHGGLSMVHALARSGRVAEHRLSPEWAGRIVACYGLPGVH